VKKILMAGAAIGVAALGAWLVRAWLPELARVARHLWNSLSALRRQPPIPGNPVPGRR
jgi:hypothetical protein